jgi:hypothetical protein
LERRPAANAGRTDVFPVGGQFEQAEALFRRINEAAVKAATEARQEQWQDNVLNQLSQINNNTAGGPAQLSNVNGFPANQQPNPQPTR